MRLQVQAFRKGFTVVELLVVIAVIAVLTAILLNVRDGVREKAQRDRAAGELAAMAQALESYRSTYGDYPWLSEGQDDAVRLWRALRGLDLPDGRAVANPRALMDLEGFQLGQAMTLEPVGESASLENAVLLDPWGQPYRYDYRRSAADSTWRRRGYILLSTGPSGARAAEEGNRESPRLPADGLVGESYFDQSGDAFDATYDNLFAQP